MSNLSLDIVEELTAGKKKFGSKKERIAYFDEVSRGIKQDRESRDRLMESYRAGELETNDLPPFGGDAPYMIGEKTPRTHKQINGAPISPGAQAYIDERERSGRKLNDKEKIPTLPKPRTKEQARASFEKYINVPRQTKTRSN